MKKATNIYCDHMDGYDVYVMINDHEETYDAYVSRDGFGDLIYMYGLPMADTTLDEAFEMAYVNAAEWIRKGDDLEDCDYYMVFGHERETEFSEDMTIEE